MIPVNLHYPISPFVEFSVNEVLRLVGRSLGREGDELWYEVFRHALGEFVGNGQGLASTSRTDTQHLNKFTNTLVHLTAVLDLSLNQTWIFSLVSLSCVILCS